MTIDQMITEADAAAASLRFQTIRGMEIDWAPIPSVRVPLGRIDRPHHSMNLPVRDLTRPRRRRHRRTPIEYRLSPAEFVISGTAAALLGGIGSMFAAVIFFGPWWQ